MGKINLRIKQRREELGLTKSQLAQTAHMTVSAISKLESGETKSGPKPENLYALSTALETSMKWLAVGKGPKELLSSISDDELVQLNQKNADLIRNIIALTEQGAIGQKDLEAAYHLLSRTD